MANDIFMKIKDVPGEATDKGYEGQIGVSSVGHSVSIPVDRNKATGEAQHGHMMITKRIDKASPLLNQKCCVGQSLGEALLTCLRAGGDHRIPYLVIKLQNAIISSVSVSGHGGDIATEQVSISYNKIDWEYKTPDGKQTKGNFNLMTNKPD